MPASPVGVEPLTLTARTVVALGMLVVKLESSVPFVLILFNPNVCPPTRRRPDASNARSLDPTARSVVIAEVTVDEQP